VGIVSNGINSHYKETRRGLAFPVEVLCGFQAFLCETKNKRVLLGTTSFRMSIQPSVRDVVSATIRRISIKFGTGVLYKNLSNSRELCENQLVSSRTLFTGVKEFIPQGGCIDRTPSPQVTPLNARSPAKNVWYVQTEVLPVSRMRNSI